MKPAPSRRGAIWIVVAAIAAASGCTHNHYYGGVPGCPPGAQSVTTQYGQVCEVPAGQPLISSYGGLSSGVVVQSNPTPTSPLVSIPANPQKVVISQPAYGPSIGRSVSRLKWRRPDPDEGLATIRTEGGLGDDGTVQR